ncbi:MULTISPECIES: P1 family peptidase [unclassified Ruegeria]|uniref:P1 family peptidase n=1 Tax=unclassified Ruegeria TaxID=2625375 RepID=UPI001489FD01|nr:MULTISPECIES: P1 family peptidase [unclassified Ruegeria]NOD76246.1 peptidase T4 [Ruegeria sp. HKCCD4332]NOD90203.1 peptidase T4 [Ruegeria sp. HKCCD4318]NOE15276.1 peptidase T4 [Ruegeria sp. HKCCD4318-2]NOG10514.1 P1 family peptidase [Ruegeria sp. HKCCD4315]
MTPGPKNLITDIPGLMVGNAQDDTLKSGATVLTAQAPFVASVHVMGGAPGTRETDLLAPDKAVTHVDAIVLSGGSAFGLDACSGVSDGLRKRGLGYPVGDVTVPIVPGAILFDLLNGGDKNWVENPYRALGRTAYEAASDQFDLGSAGAGTGALAAMQKGGLGSASCVLDSGVTVGALVAANPLGSVTTPGDQHFWAASFEMGDEFGGLGPDPNAALGAPQASRKAQAMKSADPSKTNTTIAVVATDAALTKPQCQRMAVAAHDGIARAIVPAHTPGDGDLVFATSTGVRPLSTEAELGLIGHAASVCLARAIARAVYLATPAAGDLLPCWSRVHDIS